MKKINNILKFLPVLLLLLVTSCKKELNLGNLEVTGSLEQPAVDDADAKNYLAYERYIYWETGDEIRLFSGDDCDVDDVSQARTVAFNPKTDPKFGSCSFREFNLSTNYYAIYPAGCAVDDDDEYKDHINMPTEYTYREDENADFSYGKPGMPMVAYVSTTADNENLNLDFHSVCGIARIQMYASGDHTGEEISSIVFEEWASHVPGATVNPISGTFVIHDIKTNAPTLEKTSSTGGSTISVLNIGQPVSPDKLFTFYLPLPALHGATNNIATYYIKATVNFTDASKTQISKAFRVDIRRNTLSYLKAIDLDGEGVSSQGMVGDGTQLRPFQIYTVDDLKTMREAFSHVSTKGTSATINGKTVTKDTYFRLVNSQIVLSASSTDANYWASGITNFTGHFICANGNPTTMGIENNSNAPIFESITKDGHVEGLYVRGDHAVNLPAGVTTFSPLCAVNRGKLNNCQNYCTLTGAVSLAGICVDNYGTITNAANKAVIKSTSTSGHAAGVCLTNHKNATISGYGISASAVDGAEAAAICYDNQGMVKECQVTYNNIHLKGKIGGIVYVNNGTIDHCEVVGDVLETQNKVGGICCINNSIVNGCGNGLTLLSGRERVGGIVAEQTLTGAEIRNCSNVGPKTANVALNASSSGSAVGGIIGYLTAGQVYNCLCNQEVQSLNAIYFGTIVGYHTGNTQNIANCFDGSSTAPFYGYAVASGMGENCFTPVKGTRYTKVYDSDGKILNESGTATENTVLVALNAWVTTNGSNYYQWKGTIPSFSIFPISGMKKYHRR